MLTLEPERLKNRLATTREKHRRWEGSSPRRSSGLRFHFLKVEVFSFLPQSQCNGCNLTRQGQTHHGRLDAFGQRSLVKILKRSGLYTRPSRSSFEQAFQIVVVIFIQAANGNLLSGAPQLAFDIAVFPAVAGFQPQSAVGPELALGAKPMWGLDQRHRQSGANRPQRGNLPQFGGDRMLATLRQQFSPGLLAQVLQHVQLLIKLLGSAASAGLWNFSQPLAAVAGVVDVPAGTGNRPATIESFQAIHDPRKIFNDGQITSG